MSSGDTINVNFAAISGLAGGIDSQVHQIEGYLEDLRSAIQKLAQEWNGSAQESFQQVQNKWNQSADDLKGVLARVATATHAAHDAYQQTESANAKTWG